MESTKEIKFLWNGIKVNGELIRCGYGKNDDESISVWARDYGHMPRDLFAVENDSDPYTDYFCNDSTEIFPVHPLYKFVLYAYEKSREHDAKANVSRERKSIEKYKNRCSPRTLEMCMENLKTYEEALKNVHVGKNPGHPDIATLNSALKYRADEIHAAQEALRIQYEQEQEAYRLQAESDRRSGSVFIRETAKNHPIKDGEPVVTVNWSEFPAFYDWEDDTLKLSVAAAEKIFRTFDEKVAARHQGYDKTKFTINWTDTESGEENSYEGRYDLGDNDGGFIKHIRAFGEWQVKNAAKEPLLGSVEEGQERINFADWLETFCA